MMHSTQALYDELRSTLAAIEQQISAVNKRIEIELEAGFYTEGSTVYDIRNRDGGFVLTDLLVAKSNVLAAMAQLKAGRDAQRGPGRGKW